MAKFLPSLDASDNVVCSAIIEAVTGSFGEKCTLAQFERNPAWFAVFISGIRPVLICAHNNVDVIEGGAEKLGQPYSLDAFVPNMIASLESAAKVAGASGLSATIIHVISGDMEIESSAVSVWPVAYAEPSQIAQAIEADSVEAEYDLSDEQTFKIAAILSGLPVDSEGETLEETERVGVDEVMVSTAQVGPKLSIERIMMLENILDQTTLDIMGEMMRQSDIQTASCGQEQVPLDTLLALDGLFPALVVAAAQRWSLMLRARPNIGGFFVRLRTDKAASLGFRVEAIHSESNGIVPLAVLLVLQENINSLRDCNIDTIIDIFAAWLETHGLDSEVQLAGEDQ